MTNGTAASMTDFTVKLADIPVRIRAMDPAMQRFLRAYQSDEAPCFEIRTCPEDILRERELSARSQAAEGLPEIPASDAYLETLAIYRKLAEELVERDVLLFHGSVVALDGQAYLFTAKSGTGKSTHTRLWREVFGERAVMINDDKPLLHVGQDGATAYGTPWNGKHRLGSNSSAPLKALCLLERDSVNHVEAVSAEEAFPRLLQQCYWPEDGAKMDKTLTLLERLSRTVKLYRLGCNMEREAALIAYQGMQEDSYETETRIHYPQGGKHPDDGGDRPCRQALSRTDPFQ